MPRFAGVLAVVLAVLLAPAAQAAGPAQTKRILRQQMAKAGAYSGAYVVDLDSGRALYAEDADAARIPASVQKLYTSATALQRFGPTGALSTSVLGDVAPDELGVLDGDLYLRGGGDPSFDARAAGLLADALIDATGLTEVSGRVIGDETAFDGLRGPPSAGYRLTSYVGPLSALTFNRGRTGRRSPFWQADPARFAAQAFTGALRRRGVRVRRGARSGAAPAEAVGLTSLNSPGIENLIASMNVPSDNFYAETLLKALGAEFGGSGSTTGGAAVVRSTVAQMGIRTRVSDGSGLSRSNRTSPRAVVSLLTAMYEGANALPFMASLPVAGRTGTLHDRMRRGSARGACRAKTGTLSNVSALAGYCETRDGGQVAFAFLMNYVYPWGARRLQDRMTAALARYSD